MICHEFRTPLLVHTPLGEGDAILLLDYGLRINSVWVVRMHTSGAIKHFFSEDIRGYGNPMDGRGWDCEVPKDWAETHTTRISKFKRFLTKQPPNRGSGTAEHKQP
jgi:hypothetical protein